MKRKFLTIGWLFLAMLSNAQLPNLKWAKSIGGTMDESGSSINFDASGNVYSTGYFNGTVDFDPGASTFNLTASGGTNIYISKLDASGNFMWAKNMGGTSNSGSYSIVVGPSGNVYCTGWFQGTVDFDPSSTGTYNLTAAGSSDIFIVALDASGNFIWARNMGGTLDDYATSIAIDASGNIYTSGAFQGTADFDPGSGVFNLTCIGTGSNYDIFISKLDVSGNFLWAKRMGGIGYNNSYSMVIDATGNVYTTGQFGGTADFDPGSGVFNLTAQGRDIFISKLDSSGNFKWAKMLGGTGNDFGLGITVDGSGNVFTTGNFSGIVDFDPSTAGTFNLSSVGTTDIFISKLDASGNFVWAASLGGSSNETSYSIALDLSGNIYTTGVFSGTADFDPSATGTFNLTSAGSNDIFVSKLNASGSFVWAARIGGILNDYCASIKIDASGDLFITGNYNGTANFDPKFSGTFNLTSKGASDIFICKMDQSGSGLKDYSNFDHFDIFPNPSLGNFSINIPNQGVGLIIEIYNSCGALIYSRPSINGWNDIFLDVKASGIYFVNLIDNNRNVESRKLIIQ